MADPKPASENPAWRFSRPNWFRARPEPTGPRYRLPYSIMVRAVWCAIRRQPRDVYRDARELVGGMRPKPIVTGVEHVPASGPCVLLPNHYERPDGAWVGWGAIVISEALARHREPGSTVRWVMTSSWEDCYVGPRRIAPEHVHWVLQKLAALYGIILMSPEPGETQARGRALREIFHAVDAPLGNAVALHPEAGGFEELIVPPPGMGRVIGALDKRGLPLIPVAVFEEDGRLRIHFGKPFAPGSLQVFSDAGTATVVMRTLASMLPPAMCGPYRDAVTVSEASFVSASE